MSLFEQTVPIDHPTVSELVKQHWNLELGEILKASQNHTFKASHSETGASYAVRVTPDPSLGHYERITKEIQFVRFVADAGLHHVCAPLKTLEGEFIVRHGDSVVVVFEWAKGNALDFMSFRWMLEKDIVTAWGKWLAELHKISREFSAQFPEVATNIQRWDQMHHSILAGSEIHPDDEAVVDDIQHYGVLHGDLNVSNFFYVDDEKTLSVYDWDQVQRGWYLWDVAQSELTVYMLAEAGSVVDGSAVPEADPAAFEGWMVDGYESVAGPGSIDRARLSRMLALRKSFYERFCRKAQEQGNIPKSMEHFINYIVNWFDKAKEAK
jgi:Ser/Thr protein kinase RdoA (MazF antagonist)